MRPNAAAILFPLLVLTHSAAKADVPLPADTFWFSCQGFGVRVVNRTMSETTPNTEPQRGIRAPSISAKTLWRYRVPEHALEACDTTHITADKIIGRQALTHGPYVGGPNRLHDRDGSQITQKLDLQI